jgi:LmbE family N-acetylglucosaminyl deacetylase
MRPRVQLTRPTAEIFVPDGRPADEALARSTHLAIGAHQDDLEIMAIEPILTCFQRDDRWFTGVIVTDGRGSPRDGVYAACTDEAMREIRAVEQKKAALVGAYAAQVLLDYPSPVLKDAANRDCVNDLMAIIRAASPEVVYTHNLADKHDTHVVVALRTIAAIRELPKIVRPRRVYGCEVWRSLDWLDDADKVCLDCSTRESLQWALIGVFDSQIAGGKRYDLATLGRRRANATYFAPNLTDAHTGLTFAMDLTPLVEDSERDVAAYVREFVQRLSDDVDRRIAKLQ